MSQSKILLDTNTYIRLAQTIRPLLFNTFGENEYCLYILPELNSELKNYRLKNKFPWVEEDEYIENRQYFPKVSKKEKSSIDKTFVHVWELVQTELPGPSKVDALYVAYAIELDIPVVTDDIDMTELALEFEVNVMPTLELLKIMLDCEHTDMRTISSLRDYWLHIRDRPANLNEDFERLFSNC